MDFLLSDYLHEYAVQYRERGNEIYLKFCPYCETDEAGDYTHLSFNSQNSVFRCKKCNTAGNLYKFMLDRGHIIQKARQKPYYRPADRPELTETPEIDKFYEWYHLERGICATTLEKYKVGLHKSDNRRYITYQFIDETGKIINRKFRNCTDKKDQFQEKGAEAIYYGLHVNFDFSLKYAFIVEGEDDCHAMHQLGFPNVLSVPHGATNYTPAMQAVNDRFGSLILLFDNDPTGQAGARQFAEKAGITKCVNVILPFKDARDCLKNGIDKEKMSEYIFAGKQFSCDEIAKAGSFKQSVVEKIFNPDYGGKKIRAKEFNKILGGVRTSELSIWTGHTGSGKTTCALNLLHWVEQSDWPVMVFSFENTIESVAQKLIMIQTGKAILYYDEGEMRWMRAVDTAFIEREMDALENRKIYFYNRFAKSKGYLDQEKIEQIIRYANKFYNVRFFVIDHLHYFLKIKDENHRVSEVDKIIRDIKQLTNELDIHIVLVAHPHKTDENSKGANVQLGLNCIKGSSAISQEADNFIVVERREDEKDNKYYTRWRIIKNRFMGITGEVKYAVAENKNTILL